MPSQDAIIRTSGDDAIELVKDHRNEIIEKLSDVNSLKTFLSQEFHLTEPSLVKLDFINRALQQLKSTPVDLSHYASLILEIRKKGSFSISKNTDQYFIKDIEQAIKNYL